MPSQTRIKRKVSERKVAPSGRVYYTRKEVSVEDPPSIKGLHCDPLWDPVTQKKLSGVEELERRVDFLEDHPSSNGRYFDPCTKRLLPNFAALKKRLLEIKCVPLSKQSNLANSLNAKVVQIKNQIETVQSNINDFESKIAKAKIDEEILKEELEKTAKDANVARKAIKQVKKDPGALKLQLHQDIIVEGIHKRLEARGDTRFLVGALPRGGKTYIAGGCILDFQTMKPDGPMNVLWLTAAPNETKTQVKKELVEQFSDFREFDFVEVKESGNEARTKPNAIYFMSSQLLTLFSSGRTQYRGYLSDLLEGKGDQQISMVFFDEAHKTGVGKQTQGEVEKIIQKYEANRLPFIFLTATYYRIQRDYQIPKENTFIWDYTDVLSTRLLKENSEQRQKGIQQLQLRFGKELVNEVLLRRECNGETYADMAKSYQDYPDLHFLSFDFSPEIITFFKQQKAYENGEFDLGKIFSVNKTSILNFKTDNNKVRSNAFEKFTNRDLASAILTYMTPSSVQLNANVNVPKKSHALLQRIDTISKATGSRFNLENNPSLLMFMPAGGKGTNILFTLAAWASLLMNHDWWKSRYEVVLVVDDEKVGKVDAARDLVGLDSIHVISKDVKEQILKLKEKVESQGKGLVVLAGEKMSMGISLPFIDVVMMLNEKMAADDIIQKMYRSVTPSPGKKTAFIVDLNPKRILAALYGYTQLALPDTISRTDVARILFSTYHWDEDLLARGKEHEVLGDADLTFQGEFRKMFAKVNVSSGENKKSANIALGEYTQKLSNLFFGKTVATRKRKPSIKYSNLSNADNLAILNPLQEQYNAKMAEIKTLEQQVKSLSKKKKSSNAADLEDVSERLREKFVDLETFTKQFEETIVSVRKRRKELNATRKKTKPKKKVQSFSPPNLSQFVMPTNTARNANQLSNNLNQVSNPLGTPTSP